MNTALDLSAVISTAPRECWLAISEDGAKLIAWGNTVEEAIEKARAAGVEEPLLHWSPDVAITRVFGWR
jgi:hypothetical protein